MPQELPNECVCVPGNHFYCDYCRMMDKWAEDRPRGDGDADE